MNQVVFQRNISRVLAFGAAGVTIFLITGNVTDPVNAPKLFLLGGVAGAALLLLVYLALHKHFMLTGLEVVVALFISWSLITVILIPSPFSQGIYGVYGRNTGFLAYFFLGIISLAGSQLILRESFKLIIKAFLAALGLNLGYGAWVLFFGDFLGWQNNYGALLGTFGNPNFISSFLGIGFSLVLALGIKGDLGLRLIFLTSLPVIAWQLVKADSLQGIVVAVIGATTVTYFWLREKFTAQIWSLGFLFSSALAAVAGMAGALGFGPFKQLLAQPTVALREQYWLAAINMAKSNPIFGVGMDSYGDWYRRARGPQALITPGPETVTNVAHNVYLDFLAYGGFPLLILYALMTLLSFYSIVRITLRRQSYDPIFVGLTVMWLGYHAQSIISINQLGLAVWGWLLNGAIIAFERSTALNSQNQQRRKSQAKTNLVKNTEVISPQLLVGLGLLIGLLIAVPPLSADISWTNALRSRQVNSLEKSLSGGYLYPSNSYRISNAVVNLENSKLPDYAIKYARKGVRFNPEFLDAWKMLYYATNATQQEKKTAKSQLIRLDPLNHAWKQLD